MCIIATCLLYICIQGPLISDRCQVATQPRSLLRLWPVLEGATGDALVPSGVEFCRVFWASGFGFRVGLYD